MVISSGNQFLRHKWVGVKAKSASKYYLIAHSWEKGPRLLALFKTDERPLEIDEVT